ncbi:MAG: UDP-N-acetylmuramoyl-L-alanyl-D-glutamate--2,6-diaminopimelate ligase [Halanaerobiales bacterium]
MKLKKIIKNISTEKVIGNTSIEIDHITHDSRKVKNNTLFICIEGFNTDGHIYIEEAINKGASAIVVEKKPEKYHEKITYIKVNNSRKAMSYMAEAFYNNPLENLKLIGVTGTNGKTTTTYLIKAILDSAGYKTGLIGTINNIIGSKKEPAGRTTPKSLELYRLFARMIKNNVEIVVMEVSSHALDLERVTGMEFDITVFTNLSQDHLDYHKSFKNYLNAKCKLFQQTSQEGYSIINIDDKYSKEIISASAGHIYTYSHNNKNSDLIASDIKINTKSVSYKTNIFPGKITVNLSGSFNVYNSLAAIAVAEVMSISFEYIKYGLQNIKGVPGRFELIEEGQPFNIIVDYAHTPDGMENVLKTIQDFNYRKIIIVFGCGGDRDRGKRAEMGKIAVKYGDHCILTSDNPRSEKPIAIIRDIEDGIKELNKNANYTILANRRKAIYKAIKEAKIGDVIIIFGKGHESYQVFADKTIHFDDREVAKEALNFYREGDDM